MEETRLLTDKSYKYPLEASKNRPGLFVLLVLIVFSFCIPQTLSYLKLAILLLALLLSLFSQSGLSIRTRSTVCRFFIIYTLYCVPSAVLGFIRQNPGTWNYFRVNYIYYILLLVCSTLFTKRDHVYKLLKACEFAAAFIVGYTLLYFLNETGVVNLKWFIILDAYSGVGLHDGYTHITNMNLSMLIFIFPVLLLSSQDKGFLKCTNNMVLYMVLLMSAVVMLLSGRRIVWISLAIAIVVYVFGSSNLTIKQKITRIIGVFLIAVAIILFLIYGGNVFNVTYSGLMLRFKDAFSQYDQYGRSNVRILQILALFKGFLKNPIFGSGAGIGVPDCIRSVSAPWTYEMSYNLMLYNSGIVGTLIYFTSLFALLKYLWKQMKHGDIIGKAMLISLIIGLIANATNPYISSSFDYLFWLFIPIYYIKVNERTFYLGGKT